MPSSEILTSEVPLRSCLAEPRSLSVALLRPARPARPVFVVLAALALGAAPLASAQPTPQSVTTIERVIAVVDGHPLLLSDRRAIERVRGLAEAAALEELVDERVMYQEASRLPQAEVQDDEIELQVVQLLDERPKLRSAVPLPDLHRLFARQLAILKYVEFRFRPQLRISDGDVRAAFEADPSAGDSWEAAKDELRARLERKALDERVEEWVRELRGRAEVRYVGREADDAP